MEANIYITRGLFVKALLTKESPRKVNGFPEKYTSISVKENDKGWEKRLWKRLPPLPLPLKCSVVLTRCWVKVTGESWCLSFFPDKDILWETSQSNFSDLNNTWPFLLIRLCTRCHHVFRTFWKLRFKI